MDNGSLALVILTIFVAGLVLRDILGHLRLDKINERLDKLEQESK